MLKLLPERAFIISGLKKEPKILTGRAGLKVPFFERLDKLYLGQMSVDIKIEQSVPTNDFINVNVDAVAKVRIEIISCNIQNVTDENALIADLGMDNTAKIKKDAAIAKAQAWI